jgi:hypothetical protein
MRQAHSWGHALENDLQAAASFSTPGPMRERGAWGHGTVRLRITAARLEPSHLSLNRAIRHPLTRTGKRPIDG